MAQRIKKRFLRNITIIVMLLTVMILSGIPNAQAAIIGTFTPLETVPNVVAGTPDQTDVTTLTLPNVTASTLPTPTFAGGVDLVTNNVPTPTFAGGVNLVTNAVPTPTFAGGVNLVTNTVPTPTFAGGVNLVTSTVPAITFAGGVNGVAATATSVIPAGLAATATDQSITIDGVVIPLGNSAQTAVQIATTIAGTNFAAGTSYIADGAYTVTNVGGTSATLTFTRTATGTAGNNGLTIADANYTTVNAVAATATSVIPAGLAAAATDQSITIDGVVIPLGNSAQTAVQIATTIAGTNFAAGTSYIADGAYTVTNVGGTSATLTFTRTTAGTGGNNGLTIADANYTTTNEVKATRTIAVNSLPTAADTITIGTCVVTFSNAGDDADEVNCGDSVAGVSRTTAPATPRTAAQIATVLQSLTNVSDTNHGALTVGAPSGTTISFTTTGAETSATSVAFTDGTTGAAITSTVDTAGVVLVTSTVPAITFAGGVDLVTSTVPAITFAGGVDLVTSTVPAITFAGGVDLVTSTVPAITFAGGVDLVTSTVPAITFAGGVTAVAATATSVIPAALAATATDQSITIDGVVIPLGNVAQTAIQIATTIAGTNFAAGTSYVANGAYTVTNVGGTSATLTFTRTLTGTAGNNGLAVADANYTTVNAVAATATSVIPAALAAAASDQSITIDGVVIPLGNSAQTAIQIATTIAGTNFAAGTSYVANGAYTVTNVGGTSATLTFTRTLTGTAGNNGLAVADANYTTVNGVAATATSIVPAGLAAAASDQSITIDGVVIPLGNSAQTAIQIATTIAGTNFAAGTSYVANGAYTVTNVGGTSATLTFTRTLTGTAGNNGLAVADANYTTVNGVAATATSIVPAALAAAASDQSITIDGVVIPLGNSAQTAIQIATTIAGTNFAAGTSYVANGAYTVTNVGGTSATLTFTRTLTGTAGNNGLAVADANYTTVNGVAATATSTVPSGIIANATDQSITIDGVVIPLGNVVQTAVQIATTIVGTNFAAGTSYVANGAYTVTNVGGTSATLTFTRTLTGTAGNVGLTVADPNYGTTAQVNTITIGGTVDTDDTFTAALPGPVNAIYTVLITDTTTNDIATGLNNAIQASAGYAGQAFTSAAVGSDVVLTAKVAGTGFVQTSSNTNRAAVAQVVTFTPALVTVDETYRGTINGTDYDYTVVGGDNVASVIAALAPLMDANAAVGCVDTASTTITCTASVAGTAFTYGATVVDIVPPTLTGVREFDVNADGKIDETMLTFSENIVDATVTAANFTIGGTAADTKMATTSTNGVDTNTANDAVITIKKAVGVAGTEAKAVVYTAGTLTDTAGNPLANVTIAAGSVTDNAAPVILSTSPASGAVSVASTANIVVTFSEPMNTGTVVKTSLPVSSGWSVVWSVGNTVATYSHTNFAYNTLYTQQITAGQDLAARALVAGPVANPWTFTTAMGGYGGGTGGNGGAGPGPVTLLLPPTALIQPSNLVQHDPEPAPPLPPDVQIGSLVKRSDMKSVYFIDQDNRRHAFPNDIVYLSWYKDFSGVQTISAETLAAIPLGSNVIMRPGTYLIKIQSDPKVYAVEPYGVIRWVKTEPVAFDLYGSAWNAKIKDVDPTFFINYQVGSDVATSSHPNSSVIQYAGSSDNYFINNGFKQLITSEIFNSDLFQDKFVNKNIASSISYTAAESYPFLPVETLMTLR